MKSALFVAVLGLLFAYACADDVLVLTADTHNDALANNNYILVEYYAPWCGHCKRLAPEFEKAATQLKGKVALAKVDCTVEAAICQSEGVQGYPTIKFFSFGKSKPYEGERTAAGIVSWVSKASGPVAESLKTAGDVAAFVKESPASIVAYFADAGNAHQLFEEIARELDDFTFGVVVGNVDEVDASVTAPAAKVFRDGKEFASYSGDFSDFAPWLVTEAFPAVREISEKVFQQYSQTGNPIVLFFTGLAGVEPFYEEAATVFKGKAGFAYGDGQRFKAQLSRFGASGDKLPTVVVIDPKTQNKFAFDESKQLDKETFSAWLNSIIAGEAEAYVMSEAVPADNSGPVKVVVRKNFDDIVLDSNKDVFLEIYAPWCGHCKQLVPVYEKLGESFASEPSVVIAKVDGTANDLTYPVQGFPTLLFYSADNKTPVSYDGDRSLEAMSAWIRSHASTLGGKAVEGHDEL